MLTNRHYLLMNPILTKPKLECLGPSVWTASVSARCETDNQFYNDLGKRIDLFLNGDWGSIDEDDWALNVATCQAESGGTLMGAYKTSDQTRIWIMTAGYGLQHMGPIYCYTTVLFPEEY